MDEGTVKKTEHLAPLIEKFRTLADSEQEWLLKLIRSGKITISCLQTLDAISGKELTFEEIAADIGQHPSTVSQRLNALARGGAHVDLTETGASAIAPTGRPRKLARR